MTREPYRTGGYQAERAELLASPAGQFCIHCGEPATEADHQPPISTARPHRRAPAAACWCRRCFECGRKQGGQLSTAQLRRTRRSIVEPDGVPGRSRRVGRAVARRSA